MAETPTNALARAVDALTADLKAGEPGPWPAEVWTAVHALVLQVPGQLAHMGMHYRCETCKFKWMVYLGIGLEGPEPLKVAGLALPVPFTVSCPRWGEPPDYTPCDGTMMHIDWERDVHFPTLTLIPDNAARFVLPQSAVGEEPPCGRLEMPTPALVRGRRGEG